MKIIGVDFSGAKAEGKNSKTWITKGVLTGSTLTIKSCCRTNRAKLKEFLEKQRGPMIAAMDFPFSVPQAFAEELAPEASTMPEVWEAVSRMYYEEFLELRHRYVNSAGQKLRLCDRQYSGPFSALQIAGLNMLPMTFRGMKMLHRTCGIQTPRSYGTQALRFHVPPLLVTGTDADCRTLLEVMPGVLLRYFHLPYDKYKDPSNPNNQDPQEADLRRRKRCRILVGLLKKVHASFRLRVKIPGNLRQECLRNDDCLDSAVAAVGAALWTKNEPQFLRPALGEQIEASSLEGWLYAPNHNLISRRARIPSATPTLKRRQQHGADSPGLFRRRRRVPFRGRQP